MYYIGIDIAKHTHFAAAINGEGKTVIDTFHFRNTAQGFTKFLTRLEHAGIDYDNSFVGMEATGHYWVSCFDFLTTHGFDVAVINPIQTDAYRKVDSVRVTKTDPIDAKLIANLLRIKEFRVSQMGDEVTDSMKHLTRYRMTLMSDTTMLKNKATAILDRIFPEYSGIFAHLYGPTSRAVLNLCCTPQEVLDTDRTRLAEVIAETSKRHCGVEKADELIKRAKSSVGVMFSSEALSFELRMILERMASLMDQNKRLEKEIESLLKKTPGKWVKTIPGVGTTLAAQIVSEIGDAHRFSSTKKLVAYAGMDATKFQSGEREDSGHMSKHGSAQLRYALIQGADGARRYDAYFGDYYRIKIAEGFHYYRAVSCVARKLAAVVLTLMKEERAYEPVPPKHHLPGHLSA